MKKTKSKHIIFVVENISVEHLSNKTFTEIYFIHHKYTFMSLQNVTHRCRLVVLHQVIPGQYDKDPIFVDVVESVLIYHSSLALL